MKLVETIDEMRQIRQHLAEPVGFVPTMGYLHEGHLSLVKRARAENSSVVVSIFVNPTQFGPKEDFTTYPRDTKSDLTMLEKEGADIVFMPSTDEMYPPDFGGWVEVDKVTERLEGAVRPGHFRGVTTVVAKLFNITQPTKAYFGQKETSPFPPVGALCPMQVEVALGKNIQIASPARQTNVSGKKGKCVDKTHIFTPVLVSLQTPAQQGGHRFQSPIEFEELFHCDFGNVTYPSEFRYRPACDQFAKSRPVTGTIQNITADFAPLEQEMDNSSRQEPIGSWTDTDHFV